MPLAPGSIAFIGYNADGNDGFAFIVIDPVAAGAVIHFNDNEWNGLAVGSGGAFNTGEGSLTWTNGGSELAAGTVIELLNTSSAATRNVNVGSISGLTVSLGNSDESIYAYTGATASSPETFLAAVTNTNGGFSTAASGSLGGTGLVAGSTAVVLPRTDGADVAVYDPATAGSSFASRDAALTAFNTTANWIAQSAGGDQDADNTAPDAPFSTDPQSPIAGVTFSIAALTLSISDPTVAEGNAGSTLLTYTVTASAPAPAGGITFDIATADGTAAAGSDYVEKSLAGQTIAAGATTYTFEVTVNGDLDVEADETVLVNVTNVTGATLADGQGTGTIANDDSAPVATPWINEIHYDNSGTDAGEFIEIAGAAGTSLAGYSLVLYNGDAASRSTYNTLALSGIIANQQNGYGTLSFSYPVNGIQNGSPDGIALVQGATVVQFLSYEGVFTAANGPAAGQTSTDIGVSEPGDVTGQSLQLTGTGTQYSDFTWAAQQAQTVSAPNAGQAFGAVTPTVSIGDASVAEGDSGVRLITFTVTRSSNAGAFSVDYTTAGGTATGGSDYVPVTGTPNTLIFTAGGALTQQVSITVNGDTAPEPSETFTVNLGNLVSTTGTAVIGDGSGIGTILNDDVVLTRIYTIQGSGHASPLLGQSVVTQGFVTAVDTNGFYIQDGAGDANAATSDGIFVFTSSAPTVAVGSLVNVAGIVEEFQPSGAASGALAVTEIGGAPTVTLLSTGNVLPAPVIIGAGGLTPPSSDLGAGAAFFEALEGMRVTVVAPQATGPTNGFGEIFTVAAGGVGASGLNARGDLLISGGATSFGNTDTVGGDFNPERIQIDRGLGQATPNVSVGARLADVTGIVHYSFGNYEVLATTPVIVATPSPLVKTGTTLTGDASHLLVASYNAENLDPGDGVARFNTVASEIVNRLNAPDILALQEIQDNNGAAGGTGSSVTSASQTLQMIVDAVNAAGGPQYAALDNPFIGANTNGGEPGGNIRTAYLYRTDHVSFVAGSARTVGADGSAIGSGPDTTQQTDPNNPFFASRPPLAADFLFNGQVVTLVNNHFTSKGGSGALLGSIQPPFDAGEVQRAAQAQAVNTFVDGLLTANPNARVIVTGDLNDYEFEQPLTVLKGGASISNYTVPGGDPFDATATYTPGGIPVLSDLQDMLPLDQRFDYVFEGNAQTLDHMLASNSLASGAQFQPVHINAEFFDQTSDHDPLVGLFAVSSTLTNQQTVSGQQSFTLAAGAALTVATGPAIRWDLTPPTVGANATVDNAGAISVGSGRAIDTIGSPNGNNHFTLINHEGASITSVGDTFRINANLANGVVVIDNAGTIRSTGTGGSNGQALDFNNITAATVSMTITNRATGLIEAADADAIRPGASATINNYGEIVSLNVPGSTGNDAVDFQSAAGGVVNNFAGGTIDGARHGITGNLAATIDNAGRIIGRVGSGINMDTAATTTTVVSNSGTIIGISVEGIQSGDAVDVDGLVTLDNHGLIDAQGTRVGGTSEGVTVGGGTVNNFADGTIRSSQRGITFDGGGNVDGTTNSAFAASSVYNEGLIQGDSGEAIVIVGTFGDTMTNKGTVTGSVALGGGDDALFDHVGATFSAVVDGGAGSDTVNLQGSGQGSLGEFVNFELVRLFGGDWTLGSEGYASASLETGAQTLRFAANTLADGHYDATIAGFGTDDGLGLRGIGTASAATLGAGNVLTVTGGSFGPITFQLDPGQDYSGLVFRTAADGAGGTLVTVDANAAPAFTSPSTFAMAENNTAVGTVAADDAEDDAVAYAIAGGADEAFFSIDANTGALRFRSSPDYETPEDANHDNAYNVVVSATDSFGATTTQAIGVNVTNVAESGRLIPGTNGNDNLTGTPGNDVINGGNGNDTINGADGNDILTGGNGNDTINGGRGNDAIDGGNGDDRLAGGSGIDLISGGNGNDTIEGGADGDILSGGNGRDTFIYRAVSDRGILGDLIADFSRGSGGDVLNLHEVLGAFPGVTPGSHANAFSGGYLRFANILGSTLVQVDSDGGGNGYVTLATLAGEVLRQTDTQNYVL